MEDRLAADGGPKAITLEQEERLKWPVLGVEEEAAVLRLLRANEISVSEEPKRLEEEFSKYLGARFALAEVNGTAALHSAFYVLGIGQGDEVICPSYTYWATAMPAAALGARVVFCEIDRETLNLDPEDFRRKLTPRTRAVVPVHLWGLPCEMDPILSVAREHGIAVIEDACHAHGAEYRGRKAGTIGELGVFSFQASKNLPGGEGGMLVTNNEEYHHRAVTLGHYRRAAELPERYSRYQHTSFGFKYRMSPLHAAITRVQLKGLEERNRRRNANVERLAAVLDTLPGFRVYRAPAHIKRVYYENNVIYYEEDGGVPLKRLIEVLRAEGAQVRADRYPLLHQQPFFTERGSDPDDLPVTREMNGRVLNLPTFPNDDGALADQYIRAFEKALSR